MAAREFVAAYVNKGESGHGPNIASANTDTIPVMNPQGAKKILCEVECI
jgi:hypothetical protein